VETAAVLAVLSAGDAVTRCPHRDGGELPDLPGAGPSARCTRRPTTLSGASGAGRRTAAGGPRLALAGVAVVYGLGACGLPAMARSGQRPRHAPP